MALIHLRCCLPILYMITDINSRNGVRRFPKVPEPCRRLWRNKAERRKPAKRSSARVSATLRLLSWPDRSESPLVASKDAKSFVVFRRQLFSALNGTVASNWPPSRRMFSFILKENQKGLRSRSAASGGRSEAEEAGETSRVSGSAPRRRLSQMDRGPAITPRPPQTPQN